MLSLMKSLWRAWKRLAHGIIAVQNGVLLLMVFVFGVGPAALLARLSRRELLDRDPPEEEPESWWLPLSDSRRDMDWAQRPF